MVNNLNSAFEGFFKKATGFSSYPYQSKLASSKDIPNILNIPTGAGKTEASILAIYLWRRLNQDEETRKRMPRRLVYCLPMRVLVEQTVKRIEGWLKNLELSEEIKVVTMMGGKIDGYYDMRPEENIIIVGTQDMLLSRALNRGYAASPYRWPVEFGLLNNDCVWIMDEIQLMRNGLATSVQLEAFRDKFGTYGPHKTVWMSATVNPQWLDTVDFDSKKCIQFSLGKEDSENNELSKRNNAQKKFSEMDFTISKDEYSKTEVDAIKKRHVNGSITLVIVNTVKRAQSIFKELQNSMGDECMLAHSRFRKNERDKINKELEELSKPGEKNMIIVSTQVVEAGIDISAKTMITEIAPWPSLVQRFGRCNRRGCDKDASIHIIKLDEKKYNPYEENDMIRSQKELEKRRGKSMSPGSIKVLEDELIHESVIRESDIMGLFDTAPDLTGNYTDVSSYVRSLEKSSDVSVIWRKWNGVEPPKKKISSGEMCNVPIYELESFMKGKKIWSYNRQNGGWESASTIHPGQVLLIHCDDGGYSNDIGWDAKLKGVVKEQTDDSEELEESHSDDPESNQKQWITLNDHTVHVIKETEEIIKNTNYLSDLEDVLLTVAKYHDIGKAHEVFQETMLKDTNGGISKDEFWAKRGGRKNHSVDNYRHEAISALMFLNIKPKFSKLDLATYLIASHHGKVRLSMRTIPTKKKMINHDKRYLLGIDIDKGEKDIPVFLSDKNNITKKSNEKNIKEDVPNKTDITADIARIGNTKDGQRSWIQRTLKLLKEYGPFKLGLLEAIIRAADRRASAKEGKQDE